LVRETHASAEELAMLHQAQQDNLDDEYSYDYFKKLASKIHRMGLAFQSI